MARRDEQENANRGSEQMSRTTNSYLSWILECWRCCCQPGCLGFQLIACRTGSTLTALRETGCEFLNLYHIMYSLYQSFLNNLILRNICLKNNRCGCFYLANHLFQIRRLTFFSTVYCSCIETTGFKLLLQHHYKWSHHLRFKADILTAFVSASRGTVSHLHREF